MASTTGTAMPSSMLRESTSLYGKNGGKQAAAAAGTNTANASSNQTPVIKAANIFNHQYRVRPTTVDQKRKLARNMQTGGDRRTSTMRPSTSGHRTDKSDTGAIIDKISSLNKLEASAAARAKGKENKKSKTKTSSRRDEANESGEFIGESQAGPKSAPPLSRTVNEILGDDLGDGANEDALTDENQLNADFNDNYEDFKELNFNASTDNEEDIDELNDDEEWDTDMEPEEEKPKDFSCTGIYLESCRKQNSIPVSYFVRNINNSNLKLKHHGLGEPGMRPVSAALMTNTLVTKLDLSDNWLGPKGAEHLASMLKENCFITDLNLSENHLSTEGCELLKETLKQNTSITHLTMQGNRFDDVTAVVWAEIISNTIKLEYLDLSHNEFGEEAGKLLGPAIAENNSIKYMDLSWNNLRRKGAIAIAKGLGSNSSIKKFDLGWNGFSQDGAKALFKTLKENETLEDIDLSNNRIATEGAVYIAKALITNQVLKVLKIGMNPIESAGCFAIIKQLQKNAQTKIELLDFSEVIVDKFYKEEYEAFKTMFPNIQVKTGCDEVKLKPKARVHPILKLRNYIERHRIRLIDFFNKFDKDGSMSVSREEFRSGLVELGINFSAEELDILIQDLDSDGDGEINYRDLTRLVVNSQK